MALNFQQHEPASAGRLSLIIALAVSLVCVGLYQAEGATGPLHSLQSAVEGAMVPLQRASAPLTEAVDDAGAAAAEGGVTEETYATLRQQNEQLVQQLAAAEEQRLENERLRGLLNLRDTYEITGVSGRVIGRTTDAWNQTVTLDVGSSSGVETGLTVLGPTGVVGQVISVDGRLVPGAPAHRPAVRGGPPWCSRAGPRASCAAPWTACCIWRTSARM